MHQWRFILTELDGNEVGEIWQADDRRVTIPYIGGPGAGTMAGTVDGDNPMVGPMVGTSAVDRLEKLLKVYRDGTLLTVLDLVTGEESADGGRERFSFGATGPLATRLNTRLLGKSQEGYGDGTPLAQKDLGQIIANGISVVNAEMDTGIRVGSISPSSNGYLDKTHFKKLGEMAVELSQLLNGPDIRIDATEPVADIHGTKIGEFHAAGFFGSLEPTAIFEYGIGKRNVASWRRPIDATGMANVAYHTAPGFPDSVEGGVLSWMWTQNAQTAHRRRREDIITADLQPEVLRSQLLSEHVRIRGYPRETIFFTPAPNADVTYGTHYREGDLVIARAVNRAGRIVFDAIFRIYQVTFTIDSLGTENIELMLINEGVQVL